MATAARVRRPGEVVVLPLRGVQDSELLRPADWLHELGAPADVIVFIGAGSAYDGLESRTSHSRAARVAIAARRVVTAPAASPRPAGDFLSAYRIERDEASRGWWRFESGREPVSLGLVWPLPRVQAEMSDPGDPPAGWVSARVPAGRVVMWPALLVRLREGTARRSSGNDGASRRSAG